MKNTKRMLITLTVISFMALGVTACTKGGSQTGLNPVPPTQQEQTAQPGTQPGVSQEQGGAQEQKATGGAGPQTKSTATEQKKGTTAEQGKGTPTGGAAGTSKKHGKSVRGYW